MQSKSELQESDWQTSAGTVTVTGARASWVEPRTAMVVGRIYRVVVVE